MADEEAQFSDQQNQPLLTPEPSITSNNSDDTMTTQNSIANAFESIAHLANHLPTGTVLAFQILSPIISKQGHCTADSGTMMMAYLLALCGLSCVVLSFTDSFHDRSRARKVRYGLATFNGMWVIDGLEPLPPEIAAKFKITPIDFIHAFMAVMVFAAVALLDHDVVSCFYPSPETKQFFGALPLGIGFISGTLFVSYPTTRHGIGFPVNYAAAH